MSMRIVYRSWSLLLLFSTAASVIISAAGCAMLALPSDDKGADESPSVAMGAAKLDDVETDNRSSQPAKKNALAVATESEITRLRSEKLLNEDSEAELRAILAEANPSTHAGQLRAFETLMRLRRSVDKRPKPKNKQQLSTDAPDEETNRTVPRPVISPRDLSTTRSTASRRAMRELGKTAGLPDVFSQDMQIAQRDPRDSDGSLPSGSSYDMVNAAISKAKRSLPKKDITKKPLRPHVNRTASHVSTSDVDESRQEWEVLLKAASKTLQKEIDSGSTSDNKEHLRQEVLLRLMYMIQGDQEKAQAEIQNISSEAQQVWADWIYGTATYLDSDAIPNSQRRASIAIDILDRALARMGEQGNLQIRNMAFCKEIYSWGTYVKHLTEDRYRFRPGQKILLYAEVKNFTSQLADARDELAAVLKTSAPGQQVYHTSLQCYYELFDMRGNRVGPPRKLNVANDYCQNRRHDFFIRYYLHLPDNIPDGEYRMNLTVEDLHAKKVTESSERFTILSKKRR